VVTLGLHAGAHLGWQDAGLSLSMAALAGVALIAVGCGLRAARAVPGAPR
jgi:hypothetical protein